MTFPGTASVFPTNFNKTLNDATVSDGAGNSYPLGSIASRVLLADAVISENNSETDLANNQYTGIKGGWNELHNTPHMDKGLPSGGNAAMLDGHVEWQRFKKIHPRTTSAPYFWW